MVHGFWLDTRGNCGDSGICHLDLKVHSLELCSGCPHQISLSIFSFGVEKGFFNLRPTSNSHLSPLHLKKIYVHLGFS